jgi:hypothetical protein
LQRPGPRHRRRYPLCNLIVPPAGAAEQFAELERRLAEVEARVDGLVALLIGNDADRQRRLFALEEQARDVRTILRGETL